MRAFFKENQFITLNMQKKNLDNTEMQNLRTVFVLLIRKESLIKKMEARKASRRGRINKKL